MSYLRKAVVQQKSLLIKQLIQAGIYHANDAAIHNKTITELLHDHQKFIKQDNKSTIIYK